MYVVSKAGGPLDPSDRGNFSRRNRLSPTDTNTGGNRRGNLHLGSPGALCLTGEVIRLRETLAAGVGSGLETSPRKAQESWFGGEACEVTM